MKQIIAPSHGGPDVLTYADVPDPIPGPDQIVVEVAASGVNFIDTYHRSGVYPGDTPVPLGLEGAGIVIERGEQVSYAQVGDRVAWTGTRGSYAQRIVLGEGDCYQVPEDVSLETAAALMLQGLTAHYLSASTFPLTEEHTALIHAGAGGVGLLLTQLAVARGARVITTVSTDEKEELSRAAGADSVIRYEQFTDIATDLPAAVRSLTGDNGVDVVYDGVGAATFDGSLASVTLRGMVVLFGGASGQVEPFNLQRLSSAGSVFVTRPSMGHYLTTPAERAWRSGELFDAVRSGALSVRIGETFALRDAALAHRALESRATSGKVLLVP